MKKTLFILLTIAILSSSVLLLTSTCKTNHDPAPVVTTVAGVNTVAGFVYSLSGSNVILYSNRSTNPAAFGSFFSFFTGVVGSSLLTHSNFRLIDSGNDNTPSLSFANTYKDFQRVSDSTLWENSNLSISTVLASDVFSAQPPTSHSIPVIIGTYIFQTSSGYRGILNVSNIQTDKNPSSPSSSTYSTTQKVTLSYYIASY